MVIEDSRRWPDGIIIEVRSQESAGSADQTFPYLVQNIRHYYPLPVAIVLVGCGFSSGAIDWLRTRVDGKTLLAVSFVEDFEVLVRRALAG